MKQYLLFDLDGTLTDPKVGICTCVQYALASFGIEEPDLDKLEPFIGPPLKNSFMNYYHLTEEQAEEAIEKYRERFKDTGIFENKLYDGIEQMLIALNSKGMHLAVASSKPQVFVERILEHFHIARYFRVVVGSELDGTRVNKEEVIEEALRQLFGDKPVDKSQVYMIGDGSFHAFFAFCKYNFSSISLHQESSLFTHCFRHDDYYTVAFTCPDGCQPDSSVPACRLDDDRTLLEEA